jgi:NAD(P)-dependent dehydrogenase (short-subunit alcohol dehydrogenase family)
VNKNSVAVITGAASGICRALAIRFAKEKIAGIAVADWNESGMLETAAEVEKLGVPVSSHVIDVSKLDQVERFVGDVLERHGRVTHLINNGVSDSSARSSRFRFPISSG